MARHDDGDRVRAVREPDGAHCIRAPDRSRDAPVRGGRARRNPPERRPHGPLVLVSDDTDALIQLHLPKRGKPGHVAPEWKRAPSRLREARAQLAAYFAGKLLTFDLPLAPRGTEFQRTVWDELLRIPYGDTISYADLARRIGKPSAMRAVGAANGANPIALIVPCHRVIGADGTLTGYGGGLPAKRWLLDHERHYAPAPLLELRP
jgi:methylated-DNA-[protein]-cysteine S-methyltransferase